MSIVETKRFVRSNPVVRWSIRLAEAATFGGPLRRASLTWILDRYHQSLWRRKWLWWSYGEPHFTDHTITLWRLYRGDMGEGVYSLYRGFHAAEHVKHGDRVLDIGCGDGSFTKRFLAPRASHVDAADLEKSAIDISSRKNHAPNITYRVLDAVHESLPSSGYDVITMDGVLGHIAADDSKILLIKIRAALAEGGVFIGSESIGHEGSDHLQFFDSPDDLRALLAAYFASVEIKVSEYRASETVNRTEAYWVCRGVI